MKKRIGLVISDKMNKTRTILYYKNKKHKKYGKLIKKKKKYYAHDENNKTKKGDYVKIICVRPISKKKCWIIKKKLKKK
ncbi:MAG: 30S ribosomal protein S17 [Candidatus Shikimatogenerans bostrichidophilus]|nr:MAG: 30S ribosomal protein S17 [Candidatus Shikimatogenerans bostrichidophilus]